MLEIKAKMGDNGRVLIPVEYRKMLGLNPGDELILILEEGEIRLLTPKRAVQRAQNLVQQHIPDGGNMIDRLLKDRRDEADSA